MEGGFEKSSPADDEKLVEIILKCRQLNYTIEDNGHAGAAAMYHAQRDEVRDELKTTGTVPPGRVKSRAELYEGTLMVRSEG